MDQDYYDSVATYYESPYDTYTSLDYYYSDTYLYDYVYTNYTNDTNMTLSW